MIDMDTFLLILYVMVDDFCKSHLPAERRPGLEASLTRSEVITLVIFGEWYRFRGQRDFYRFANQKLRPAFPTLPARAQYNRLTRRYRDDIVAFFLYLVELLEARQVPFEISVGQPALGPYVVDTGFEGEDNHQRWHLLYQAETVCKPISNSKKAWPKAQRRWLHSIRQTVETVYAKLTDFFRLDRERPHDIRGFQANLAAKMALHNFCIWLNKQLGRAPLAFADLLGW